MRDKEGGRDRQTDRQRGRQSDRERLRQEVACKYHPLKNDRGKNEMGKKEVMLSWNWK